MVSNFRQEWRELLVGEMRNSVQKIKPDFHEKKNNDSMFSSGENDMAIYF